MPERTDTFQNNKLELREPKQFSVVIHNDDYTPMDFVVLTLKEIFHISEEDATQIMLEVHLNGKGVVGSYTFDIALTKKNQTEALAKLNGYPLKATLLEVK